MLLFTLDFCDHMAMIKIYSVLNVADGVLLAKVRQWLIPLSMMTVDFFCIFISLLLLFYSLEGVYVFKCSNAELLFKSLLEVINNATHLNSSNITINVRATELRTNRTNVSLSFPTRISCHYPIP